MIPKPEQDIQVIFRNSFIARGRVITWTDTISTLETSDGIITIMNTAADVVAVKIYVERARKPVYAEMPELPEREPEAKLRAMKLAELHLARKRVEAEAARQLMTTFQPSQGTTMATYGLPRRISEPTHINSTEKDRRSNTKTNR